MTDVIHIINTVAWVGANFLIAYSCVAIILFVIGYYILFDPRATTGGKLIFRFMLSLVGVIGLIFVGVFVDPAGNREWFTYPGDVDVWRPLIRFGIYFYVSFTITSLAILLVIRKFKPSLVRKASDLNLVKPRHTNEIPIISSRKENDLF